MSSCVICMKLQTAANLLINWSVIGKKKDKKLQEKKTKRKLRKNKAIKKLKDRRKNRKLKRKERKVW